MSDTNTKITLNIDKSQEKTYIKVPFNVPYDVEAINISYSYYGSEAGSLPKDYEKNVIDLAVLDEQGMEVGATGSNKKNIIISASYSTPGYKRVNINAGQWTIICGAYLVRSEGVEVEYSISYEFKQYKWLKGDLHTHSVNSDGKLSVNELGLRAREEGLNFIISTDHNNFFHNKSLPQIPNLTIIPGVEFTHYKGHMNIWGLETPYTASYAVNTLDEFKVLHKEARDRGGLISLNHPHCSLCPWRWGLDVVDYDAVEVWNGPMRKDNLTSIEWWHNELLKGRKLVAVGGSDYHKDFPMVKLMAKPTTLVYAKSKSQEDILDAIEQGRVVTIKSSSSPTIEMTSDNAVVGDTIKWNKDSLVNISISKLLRKHRLVVYNNDKIIYDHKSTRNKAHSVSLKVEDKGFVRAEIRYYPKAFERLFYRTIMFFLLRKQAFDPIPEFISAITNPIYYD